jgi:hypothetical protein
MGTFSLPAGSGFSEDYFGWSITCTAECNSKTSLTF